MSRSTLVAKLFEVRESDFFRSEKIFSESYFIYYGSSTKIKMDQLFIALAKDSGETDYTNFVDLINLREPIRSELRQLFHIPEEEKRLSYPVFRASIVELANSYLIRSAKVQEWANAYILRVLREASIMSDDELVEEDLVVGSVPIAVTAEDTALVSIGPIPAPTEEASAGIFRSISTGSDDFTTNTQRDYFVPSPKTLTAFNSCFNGFFTENGRSESKRLDQLDETILKRYGQFILLFNTGDGIVRREHFVKQMCILVENKMRDNPAVERAAITYCNAKIDKAKSKLEELMLASPSIFDFPVGSRVLFKPWGYKEGLPATVKEVVDEIYYKHWKIVLDNDITGEVHEAYRNNLEPNPNATADEVSAAPASPAAPPPPPTAEQLLAIRRDEYAILTVLRNHIGPNFLISTENGGFPSLAPKAYSFYFKDHGDRADFEFKRWDYGVLFRNASGNQDRNFLPDKYFDDSAAFPPERLAISESARETNRCFFLHLGRALGIHPYALAVAYRQLAQKVIDMSEPGDMSIDTSQSVLDRNQFVDSMALASIWPVELDEYQILIINLDGDGQFNSTRSEQQSYGFTHIRPPSSPYVDADGNWSGKDILLTLQFGHFTYLEPDCDILKVQPVKTLLDWGKRIEVNIATPFDLFVDPMSPDRERLSINSALQGVLTSVTI